MIQPDGQDAANIKPVNGADAMEARLRQLFSKQQQLRELLDRTRQELDDLAAELFGFQEEYCTDAAREEEYAKAIERILGFDPRIDLNEVQDILAGRRSCDMKEFIDALERDIQATPSQGAE